MHQSQQIIVHAMSGVRSIRCRRYRIVRSYSDEENSGVFEAQPKTTVTFLKCGDPICEMRLNRGAYGWPCIGGHFNGDVSIGLTPETFPNFCFTPREFGSFPADRWAETRYQIKKSWSGCDPTVAMYEDDKLHTCLPAEVLVRIRTHIKYENARRLDAAEPKHIAINVRANDPIVGEDLEGATVCKQPPRNVRGKGGLKSTKPEYARPIPSKEGWIHVPYANMSKEQRRVYNNINTFRWRARKSRKITLEAHARASYEQYHDLVPPPSVLDVIPAKIPIWMECIEPSLVDQLVSREFRARHLYDAIKSGNKKYLDKDHEFNARLGAYVGDKALSAEIWLEILIHDTLQDLVDEGKTPLHFIPHYTPPFHHELEDAKTFRAFLDKARSGLSLLRATLEGFGRSHPIWKASETKQIRQYLRRTGAEIDFDDTNLKRARRMMPPHDGESPLSVAMLREANRRNAVEYEDKRKTYIMDQLRAVAAKEDATFRRKYKICVRSYLNPEELAGDALSQKPNGKKKAPNTRFPKHFLEEARGQNAMKAKQGEAEGEGSDICSPTGTRQKKHAASAVKEKAPDLATEYKPQRNKISRYFKKQSAGATADDELEDSESGERGGVRKRNRSIVYSGAFTRMET